MNAAPATSTSSAPTAKANFKITSTTSNGKRTRTKSGVEDHIQTTDYTTGYKVTVENKSSYDEFKNIKLRYVIYKQSVTLRLEKGGKDEGEVTTKIKASDDLIDTKTGTIPIPLLKARGTFSFVTDNFIMEEIKYGNYSTDNGDKSTYYKFKGDTSSKDKIKGIWIKMYVDDKLIFEKASSPLLAKNNKWPFSKK